jgi:hypothetical protein
MPLLTLYHTSGCHLCEEAEALVAACFVARGMATDGLKRADIAEDRELLKRYGLLIPVLRVEDSGQELHWPFGLDEIKQLLHCVTSINITEECSLAEQVKGLE